MEVCSMKKDTVKGFILGVCTFALFVSVGTAFASGKLTNINVFQGGIKLFVDGKLTVPTDSDGKVVEPFIYDGTTYLPLRALSNALTNNQKPVSWDSNTLSIYVGQALAAAQTDIGELTPYEQNGFVLKGDKAAFSILDKTITPFNNLTSGSLTYMLNSNYSQINGNLIIPYKTIGNSGTAKLSFYNVNKKGKETLIKEFSTGIGDDTVSVSVDVRGVEILKIVQDNRNIPGSSSFYNVTLAGIQ
jgi:hypothetical protein